VRYGRNRRTYVLKLGPTQWQSVGKIQFWPSYLWLWRFSNTAASQECARSGTTGENERFRKKTAWSKIKGLRLCGSIRIIPCNNFNP